MSLSTAMPARFPAQRPLAPRAPALLAALAVFLALAVAGGWTIFLRQSHAQLEQHFGADSLRLKAMLEERQRAHTELLRAAAGLFTASDEVTRQDFSAFVQSLDLERVYPGIQGIGFARALTPEQLDAHVAAIRASGFPEFVVWPPGPRALYTSIELLEPFSGRNLRAFGFDMYSEPRRAAAMASARDTGSIGITQPVRLVQETGFDVQVGALAYYPVYRKGAATQTVEQRRATLVGWTYSPYRMTDLMEGIFDLELDDVHVEVFDGLETTPDQLVFDSQGRKQREEPHLASTQLQSEVDGHVWTLRLHAHPRYAARAGFGTPWAALGAMVLIALLIFGITGTLLGTHARAAAIAARLTVSLRESEDRYRSVVENLEEGVFQTDREGRWTFLNPAFATITGRAVATSLGKPLTDLVAPEDRARVSAEVAEVFEGRRESLRLETRLTRPDGQPGAWVNLEARATVGPAGIAGLSGTLADITRNKAAELATNAARDAAEAANRSKSVFLATMSHEIRTPMNGVMGSAQVLLGTTLDDDQRVITQTIIKSTESLMVVINDILDASKIEAGRLELQHKDFELASVLDDVVRLFRPQAEAAGLRLELAVAEDVPGWIVGDAARLRQVLLNLVGNGLKFTERGSVRIEVKRGPDAGGRPTLTLAVKDTGPGISPEVVQKLFSPFEQGGEAIARRYGGTGLGLSISKQLIELMGGRIHLETTLGEGATFTITLPCEVCTPRVMAAPVATTRPLPPALRALVVDDNATNQLVLSRLVRQLGLDTAVAADGLAALDRLQAERFDVVFMDVQMPKLDGDEAARRIRAGAAGPWAQHVPIIALTADAMEATRIRCMHAGMNDFIAKPVRRAELEACLGRWLGREAAPAKITA